MDVLIKLGRLGCSLLMFVGGGILVGVARNVSMMGRNRRKSRIEQMRKRSEVYRSRHRILSRMRIETPEGIEKDIQEVKESIKEALQWKQTDGGCWYVGGFLNDNKWL